MSDTKNNDLNDFEQSLQQLEAIVTKMERGELSLEQSLEAFEEGVKLTRSCQETLRKAEQRVSELLQDGSTVEVSKDPDQSDLDKLV
jgi:exodeoxyribonuclease VII small subunit